MSYEWKVSKNTPTVLANLQEIKEMGSKWENFRSKRMNKENNNQQMQQQLTNNILILGASIRSEITKNGI